MQCVSCGKETDTYHIIGADGLPLRSSDNGVESPLEYCQSCLNNQIVKGEIAYYKGVYYSRNHPDIRRCDVCSCPDHVNIISSSGGYCKRCALFRSYGRRMPLKYCPKCGVFHKNGMCDGCLSDAQCKDNGYLRFTIRNDSKSWDAKGGAVTESNYISSIGQFQTERDLDEKTEQMLKQFYHDSKKFIHYYTREPVYIEGTVSYNNTKIVKDVIEELRCIRYDRDMNIRRGKKVSKYSNCYCEGIDDSGLLIWKYIDIMGNIRERKESINKFFTDCGKETTNANMTGTFKYVLSSNINHKIKAFMLNDKVGSCQKSHNYDSYAKGAYDAITNGCNCPILIYGEGKTEPFARITTRIMYDKQGQEYILIDRVYHSGEFSDQELKGEIYKSIVKDLKQKGYKVIASNYSAHDNSTYGYLASLGMTSNTVIKDLCQPLRRLVGNYGYYCDGGTVVRQGNIDGINRATDYLDKGYLL